MAFLVGVPRKPLFEGNSDSFDNRRELTKSLASRTIGETRVFRDEI